MRYLHWLLYFAIVSCAVSGRINNDGILLRTDYDNHYLLKKGQTYYIINQVNLRGKTMELPEGCELVFKGGNISNGRLLLNNTQLDGIVDFRCRVGGTVKNDTVRVSWFNYNDHKLADAFGLSERKVLIFGDNTVYPIDYALLVPSCIIVGNNCTIILGETEECSPSISVAKIRNAHYDGGGVDSFTIENLNFETSADKLFLFSMQNTKNCQIIGCRFTCRGNGLKSSHAFDMRGHNWNTIIERCSFINEADANAGGGLWIRSFGEISKVLISKSTFYNNSTDEILAFNAIEGNISNVKIESCFFQYERGKNSPEPHVMWGMTYKKGSISNVIFNNCRLNSDFIPAYVLNDVRVNNMRVSHCIFDFSNATLNSGKLNTTMFNGGMSFDNNKITISDIKRQDSKTSITLFSGKTVINNATIINDCGGIFIGGAKIYNSDISYNNSQLFNGQIPVEMVNCTIKLGKGTPKLAANPYSQNTECSWHNNVIESEHPVDFNLSYNKNYLRNVGNRMKNITIQGDPFRAK